MNQIIGGKFGLPIEFSIQQINPSFITEESILLFNARSGIKIIVDWLKAKTIWLPSYLCPTILAAVDSVKTEIRFYSINEKMMLSNQNFINQIKPEDLFLYIDYFGFPFEKNIIPIIKERGAYLLHDCSQALFVNWQKSYADFVVFSPRKFLGVPDGGILINKSEKYMVPPILSPAPKDLFLTLLYAVLLRREFDNWGGKREWFALFHQAESKFSPAPYAMSELSTLLLQNAFDYEQIKLQRRKNFKVLAKNLAKIALFPDLPEDVVPLGFPIVLNQRDQVQQLLFDNNIYPPIHWQIKDAVPIDFIDSHNLSKAILTLPCDQRYSEDDMNFIVERILEPKT